MKTILSLVSVTCGLVFLASLAFLIAALLRWSNELDTELGGAVYWGVVAATALLAFRSLFGLRQTLEEHSE